MSAEQNRELIRRLYDGLDRADGEAMAACYAADAKFSDPVFADLPPGRVRDMWRMLCERSTDLDVELVEHDAEEASGTARWVATYTFAATGRPVKNDVRATFRFADGLIAEQRDVFSFWAWSRQALGPIGVGLGWNPLLRIMVGRRATGDLARYAAKRRD